MVNELVDGVSDAGRWTSSPILPGTIRSRSSARCSVRHAEDWAQFSRWAEAIFKMANFSVNLADETPAILRGWAELDAYVDDMVAERRHRLTDDLLSDLIRAEDDGDRLNADELRMTVASLLLAGTDTTRNQLAASLQVLLDHPEQWAMLREHPELAMPAVEESCATPPPCAARSAR